MTISKTKMLDNIKGNTNPSKIVKIVKIISPLIPDAVLGQNILQFI